MISSGEHWAWERAWVWVLSERGEEGHTGDMVEWMSHSRDRDKTDFGR